MLRSRPSIRPLLLLALVAGLGLGREAAAQVPPAVPSSQVPGTLNASGTYSAQVNAPGQFFERSGTYQASVTFTAAVSISGLSVLTQSGAFQANGPFTATVSAPGVTPFTVTGTYTASGTFTSGTFTSSGQWAISTGGNASGTHNGGGTYALSTMTANANGQYEGTVTNSPRGPFSVQGPYGGSGSFALGAMRMTSADALQTSALSDMIAGIAGLAATGPISAAALEMQNNTTPPAAGPAGTFSGGTIAPAGVSIVRFTGTTVQLGTAAAAANIATASATVGGRMLVGLRRL